MKSSNSKQLLLAFVSILLWSASYAQVDPKTQWEVLDDPLVKWVYNSKQRALTHKYREKFYAALPELTKLFGEIPRKTTIVINDPTDLPNGSATILPYPTIRLFPVLPLPNSNIGETNDSLYDLVSHEYTHILNMHPVHGIMKPLKYLFGSVVKPNALLPRWYLEGLAVYTETLLNPNGGRLRSQNFESMVRAISKDNKWSLYPIDEINGSQPDWVGGQRPYLLGGLFFESLLSETNNPLDIKTLNQSYSRRLPYGLNGPIKELTNKSAGNTLDLAYKRIQKKATAQISQINAPAINSQPISKSGFSHFSLKISPDKKWLSYLSRTHNSTAQLSIYNIATKETKTLTRGDGLLDASWSEDSKRLYFNKIDVYKRYRLTSDLYSIDINTKSEARLSKGARALQVAEHPSTNSLYFIQNAPGRHRIKKLDRTQKKITTVYQPKSLGTRLSSPLIHKDRLYFIEVSTQNRQLIEYSITTNKLRRFKKWELTSLFDIQDNSILVTSQTHGIEHLYKLKLPITNVEQLIPVKITDTRITGGTLIDSQTIFYSELDSQGGKVYTAKLDSPAPPSVQKVPPLLNLPQLGPPQLSHHPKSKPNAVSSSDRGSNQMDLPDTQPESYSPWGYLLPRYWIPYAYVLDGGTGFTGTIGGQDPLGKHSYSLVAEWDTLTEKAGGIFTYTNQTTPATLQASIYNRFRYNRSSDSTLEDRGGRVSSLFFVPGRSFRWRWGLHWNYSATDLSIGNVERSGPALSLSYQNARQRGFEISPETGTQFSLFHQYFSEDLGDVDYHKTHFNLKSYFSNFLPSRHVLFGQLNVSYAPMLEDLSFSGQPVTSFYTETISGNFVANTLIPPLLQRGYLSGSLIGYNLISTNFEYRFPISYLYSGLGTTPVFLKSLQGGLVLDGISLDGFKFNVPNQGYQRSELGDVYWGTGAELHLNSTLGYHLPVRFTFGVYYGMNKEITNNEVSTFFTFSM